MNHSQKIQQRLNITDVLNQYGFKPNNHGKLVCPLHAEKSASLKIYDNNTWYCFGCNSGSTIVDFVMKLYSVDYLSACKMIDTDFNLGIIKELTQQEKQQYKAQKHEKERQDILKQEREEYSKFQRKWLRDYRWWLIERGFEEEIKWVESVLENWLLTDITVSFHQIVKHRKSKLTA